MTYKTGIKRLKEYIDSEKESCDITDNDSNFTMAVKNQQRTNAMILEDILDELERDSLKLNVTFSAPKANELPHLGKEIFEENGIIMEAKGGMYTASMESMQTEYIIFWVSNIIGISSGAISIADFIHTKLKNYKNSKIRIGSHQLSPPYTIDDIRKIIKEELEHLKEEENKEN